MFFKKIINAVFLLVNQIEEGNGNPLQSSCLENPIDRGAWQAAVHGVAGVGHVLATKPPPEGEDGPGQGRLVPSTKASSGLTAAPRSAGCRPRPAVNQGPEGARQLCIVRWGWGYLVQRTGGCTNFFCKVGAGVWWELVAKFWPLLPHCPLAINCF